MYKRPKIEDFIDDPDRNGSDGCTVVFYQDEEEEYLEALEKYCDFLESIGGAQVLLRAREEEIEELSRCVKAYDNDIIDTRHALFMAIEERYLDDSLAFKRLNYLNEFNIDKDFDGVIEFENKKYDTKDIVMIKHTGPYKIYAGKTKNFYRLKLQTKETFITIVNEGLTDGFNFISSIQRKYIR